MLSILKSSKLNYLVKETPYSAFVKDIQDISGVTLVSEDTDANLKRENLVLKARCKSLEVEIGFLKIHKEKLELSNETLDKEKNNLNIKIERLEPDICAAKLRILELFKKVEEEKEESTTNKHKKEFLQSQSILYFNVTNGQVIH